jgi:hypothetical protein
MKRSKWLVGLILIGVGILWAGVDHPLERNHHSRYSDNDDVWHFLSSISTKSPYMEARVVGETSLREPLYLTILTREGIRSPEQLDRSKPTVFIFASQHGDEQSAKEAALYLIRDVALDDRVSRLDHINLLVMPLVNPHGVEADQRRNHMDLDLNRDHVKLEAAETRAVHDVFHAWFPEVTLDVHEKGEDYYLQQIGVISNVNIADTLQQFARSRVLSPVAKELERQDISFHEYLIRQEIGIDEASGADMERGTTGPPRYLYRYSTTDVNDGRNSPGIFNTLSFIQEGVSSGRLDDIRERTRRQLATLRAVVDVIAEQAPEIRDLVRSQRQALASDSHPVHLRMRYTSSEEDPRLTLKRIVTPDDMIGTIKVDKNAGDPVGWAEIDRAASVVVDTVITDWRPVVKSTASRKAPAAYAIPPDRQKVIRTLRDHHVPLYVLSHPAEVTATVDRVIDIVPSRFDYIAPDRIEVEAVSRQRTLSAGMIIVPVQGRFSHLVPILLDPLSAYGLIRYFTYQLVPAKGETYPILGLDSLEGLDLIPLVDK